MLQSGREQKKAGKGKIIKERKEKKNQGDEKIEDSMNQGQILGRREIFGSKRKRRKKKMEGCQGRRQRTKEDIIVGSYCKFFVGCPPEGPETVALVGLLREKRRSKTVV